MKRILALVYIILSISLTGFGQKGIEAINGFKYAYVNMLVYEDNKQDIYGITEYLRNELSKKGLIILDYNSNSWPSEAKTSPCLVGQWYPSHTEGSIPNSAKGGYVIKNCKGEIVYENFSIASHFGYYYNKNTPLSIEKAFKPIRSFQYTFTETLTPKIDYPIVESTAENEESIRKYLENNKLDPIEGIYKSYISDHQLSYYKFGIIKQGEKYKAIVIESDLTQWKPGEVKASFEQSSMKGLYSAKWFMGNKTSFETFAALDNTALLTVELKNSQTGEIMRDKFIKMFPAIENGNPKAGQFVKSYGSGFFISKDGIVATNAHVVEDAKNIKISLSNESGNFVYNAKIILIDTKNDVALLRIDDEKFKELSSIPYSIVQSADIGEKVFTIGYPLNDIMGTNYKVTDGIVSANSGISDDVRYYQISVPLQPGNSGGPLFDKDGNVIGITSARLNSNAVGTQVENVNYAVKASYLLALFNMLPNTKINSSTTLLQNMQLSDQVKVLKNYVCLIEAQ